MTAPKEEKANREKRNLPEGAPVATPGPILSKEGLTWLLQTNGGSLTGEGVVHLPKHLTDSWAKSGC